MAIGNGMSAAEALAVDLVSSAWKDINASYGSGLSDVRKLEVFNGKLRALTDVATVLLAGVMDVAEGAAPMAARRRLGADIARAAAVASRGTGTIDNPIRKGAHVQAVEKVAAQRGDVEKLNSAVAELSLRREQAEVAGEELSKVMSGGWPRPSPSDPAVAKATAAARAAEDAVQVARLKLAEARGRMA